MANIFYIVVCIIMESECEIHLSVSKQMQAGTCKLAVVESIGLLHLSELHGQSSIHYRAKCSLIPPPTTSTWKSQHNKIMKQEENYPVHHSTIPPFQ